MLLTIHVFILLSCFCSMETQDFVCGKVGLNFQGDPRIASPWTASLITRRREVLGTGVIVGPFTVLTTATAASAGAEAEFVIPVGISTLTNSTRDRYTQFLEPDRVDLHGEWALMVVKSEITFSTRVRPICLPNASGEGGGEEIQDEWPRMLTGFSDRAGELSELTSKVLNDSWTWSGSRGSGDGCKKDELSFLGGSVLIAWKKDHWNLFGVVKHNTSRFQNCEQGLSRFITRITAPDLNWIRDMAGNGGNARNATATNAHVPEPDQIIFESAPSTAAAAASLNSARDCGVKPSRPQAFIVNGTNVPEPRDWPWHAAIFKAVWYRDEYEYVCGATLISPNAVLTAAHCVVKTRTDILEAPALYRVIITPLTSKYDPRLALHIASIHVPEYYNAKNFEADIAILKLRTQTKVQPACIPTAGDAVEREQTGAGSEGVVVGFGVDESGQTSATLRMATFPVVRPRECFKVSGRLPSASQFCAGVKGKTPCEGDSGGGWVTATVTATGEKIHYIQGIVSHGVASTLPICDTDLHTIFTRVGVFKTWIADTLSS